MKGIAENPEKGERFGYFRRPYMQSAIVFLFVQMLYVW